MDADRGDVGDQVDRGGGALGFEPFFRVRSIPCIVRGSFRLDRLAARELLHRSVSERSRELKPEASGRTSRQCGEGLPKRHDGQGGRVVVC